ncbi:MAG: hypothetical protein INF43_02755 [Alphaproteobacteria bacterium]|jgi:(p)ppGpp synthase/HD superfamily hydrolase|nr:hypothetical protein [Alphaproteobacteria bacterium]
MRTLNYYLDNPSHHALWQKVLQGYKEISGRDWQTTAGYRSFWTLCERLHNLAYGGNLPLPDVLKPSLAFMLGAHAGRVRKGLRERPYFHHILMVVYLTWLMRLPITVQLAAIHHDDVEDLPDHLQLSTEDVIRILRSLLPPEHAETVIRMVLNLSNDPKATSKHEGQMLKMAKVNAETGTLKLLDRIANLYDLQEDKQKRKNWRDIQRDCENSWELTTVMPVSADPSVLAMLAFAHHRLAVKNHFAS